MRFDKRNPLRQSCTVGFARGESRRRHGEPKRARSWKRRIGPRNTFSPSCFPLLGGRTACIDSFLKRNAHAIGVYRAELFRAPRLGLLWTIRVHFSPAFLVFGIHRLNTLNGDSHHGLVSDLARQFFVAHTGYVQVGLAAVDSCVIRWRGIAKGFLEAAD